MHSSQYGVKKSSYFKFKLQLKLIKIVVNKKCNILFCSLQNRVFYLINCGLLLQLKWFDFGK